MKVSELPGTWGHTLIEKSPLWDRDVSSLKPLDLTVFLHGHLGTVTHLTARNQAQALVDTIWQAVLRADVTPWPEVCFFKLPLVKLSYGELRAMLLRTTPVRRNAILFGLETGLSVPELIELEWTTLQGMPNLSPLAMSVAYQVPQHFRLRYAFWENLENGAAAPLLGLRDSIYDLSDGLSYDALTTLYKTAVPIDGEADLADFLEQINLSPPDNELENRPTISH
jgi:hypothetical protein